MTNLVWIQGNAEMTEPIEWNEETDPVTYGTPAEKAELEAEAERETKIIAAWAHTQIEYVIARFIEEAEFTPRELEAMEAELAAKGVRFE
ncbi:hypothetical protein [Gracilibacillus timonensis]|uniref:hypothetical protein n=1 Tax=Gracilibacillus timonensis TaxID=1816696 RepID=UPI000825BD30|nr:hypothetical protein [Gracilibacillus timonensis]